VEFEAWVSCLRCGCVANFDSLDDLQAWLEANAEVGDDDDEDDGDDDDGN
jgi:hypothetical protein